MKHTRKNIFSFAFLSLALISSCSCNKYLDEEILSHDVNTDGEIGITPIDADPENEESTPSQEIEDPTKPKLKLGIKSATVEVGDTFRVPYTYKNFEENETNGKLQILGGSDQKNDSDAIVFNLYNALVIPIQQESYYPDMKDKLFDKYFAVFTANKVGEVELTLKNNVAEAKCTITVVEKNINSIAINSRDYNVTRRIRNASNFENTDHNFLNNVYNYYAMGIEKGKSTQLYVSVFEDHNLVVNGIHSGVTYTPSHPEYFSVSETGLLTINNNVPYLYGGYCFSPVDNSNQTDYYRVYVRSKSNPLNTVELRLCIINRDVPNFAIINTESESGNSAENIANGQVNPLELISTRYSLKTNFAFNPNDKSFSYRQVIGNNQPYEYKDYINLETRINSYQDNYMPTALSLVALIPEEGIENRIYSGMPNSQTEHKETFLRFTLETTNKEYFQVLNNRTNEYYAPQNFNFNNDTGGEAQSRRAFLISTIKPLKAYTRSYTDSDECIKVNFLTRPELNTKIYFNVKEGRE